MAPNAPESHVALGYYYYWGNRDYGRALQEFSAAVVLRPNVADVHAAIANVARRQGSPEQSLTSRTRAIELDPATKSHVFERGFTYQFIRRYDEAERDLERASASPGGNVDAHMFVVAAGLARDGSLDRMRAAGHVDSVVAHAQ